MGEVNDKQFLLKRKASTSILNIKKNPILLLFEHFTTLSLVTKPCDQRKLENYVALVDVQPTGAGRMEHKMGLHSGQWAKARALSTPP